MREPPERRQLRPRAREQPSKVDAASSSSTAPAGDGPSSSGATTAAEHDASAPSSVMVARRAYLVARYDIPPMVELTWDPIPTRGRGGGRSGGGVGRAGERLYEVERITDRRGAGPTKEYFVKWRGYPLEQGTWEPLSALGAVLDFVERFERCARSEAVAWPTVCDGGLVGRRVMATFLDEEGESQWYPALIVEHRPDAPELRFVIHFEEDGVEIEADLPDETVQLLAGSATHCECPTCTEDEPEGRKLCLPCR